MNYETIRLIGGPADGEVREWSGGDVFRMRYLPDVFPFTKNGVQSIGFGEVEHHEYRRSINDPSAFVHQP